MPAVEAVYGEVGYLLDPIHIVLDSDLDRGRAVGEAEVRGGDGGGSRGRWLSSVPEVCPASSRQVLPDPTLTPTTYVPVPTADSLS